MECPHRYFKLKRGKLRCAQCNKTPEQIEAESKGKPEDKMLNQPEDKEAEKPEDKEAGGAEEPPGKMWPPQVKRQTTVVKKGEKPKSGRGTKAGASRAGPH